MWYNNRTCECSGSSWFPRVQFVSEIIAIHKIFTSFHTFGEVFWGLSISFFDASKYLIIINSLQKLLSKIQLLVSN